jgi:hypothetical protein
VHAVAGILEDVGIPFVTDIPTVDGFSTIVCILPSPFADIPLLLLFLLLPSCLLL